MLTRAGNVEKEQIDKGIVISYPWIAIIIDKNQSASPVILLFSEQILTKNYINFSNTFFYHH